ncbi:EAL and HDOD domain-containing protein [Marinicellulosiphila megalodicopiae]|uniref:EAL and HDOD domain-containing protein n=1 Tax=Marinicellulosiphila megalodicopiae TaxID=2724896 RepID=UPI003BAF3A70
MDQILFAKQSILDRKQQTVAHELLYRSGNQISDLSELIDDNHATANVLINAFSEYVLPENNELIFINFPKDLLFSPPPLEMTDNIVIEILETVSVDDALIDQVNVLKKSGYKLALDDYQGHSKYEKLLPLMDIIKVEVLGLNNSELINLVSKLNPYKCKLLAEKVENQEMFDLCLQLGFSLFQGFFFSKPQLIKGQKMTQNQSSLLKLMAQIHKVDISLDQISVLISQDPQLCVGLLKLVNSSLFKRQSNVNSIQQACIIIGLAELRNWVQLLSFAKFDQRPDMFHFQSLLCALLMKEIAKKCDKIDPNEAFTIGICVHLESIMDLPFEAILEKMPFETHIKDAILKKSGDLGQLMIFCLTYVEGQWDKLNWQWFKNSFGKEDVLPDLYEKAYLKAKQSFE